jgi:hypothetical protein
VAVMQQLTLIKNIPKLNKISQSAISVNQILIIFSFSTFELLDLKSLQQNDIKLIVNFSYGFYIAVLK